MHAASMMNARAVIVNSFFFFFLFSDPQQTLDARGQLCMYPVHGIWPLKLFESPRT